MLEHSLEQFRRHPRVDLVRCVIAPDDGLFLTLGFDVPTVSGGKHRNHCPLCLTSRHVDAARPGDRACPCRALMPAVGTYFRPGGEQMLVHLCNGCGAERTNRIAADDNPVALRRLALVAPPKAVARVATDDEAIA